MLKGLRVLMVTSVNMAANPRCLKELKTLVSLGANVTVIKFDFNNWSVAYEKEIEAELSSVRWIKLTVGRERVLPWITSTIISKLASTLSKIFPSDKKLLAYKLDKRSYLINKRLQSLFPQFDIVIGHNPGVFWPVCQYANKHNIPYGIDVEDYHAGESGKSVDESAQILMKTTLAKASYITAASPQILSRVIADVGKKNNTGVVNNVFELKMQPSYKENEITPDNPHLKIVWFSQYVGLNRGLQDVLKAINCINNFPIQLTVIGNCTEDTKQSLLSCLVTGKHRVEFVNPLPEKKLFELLSDNHIGLALEPGFSINNDIALSNKILSYILAGNAVIASDTEAQSYFINNNPGVGIVYQKGNGEQLAQLLEQLYSNQQELTEMRNAAYTLAASALNWEQEQHLFIKHVLLTIEHAA